MQPNVYSSIIDNCQDMEAIKVSINTVQSLSHVRLFTIPWTEANQASLSITNSQILLELMSIELVTLSNHLILCHPLLLLPSIISNIGSFPMSQFFASVGQGIGVSASASVLPMNIQDWFPLGWTGLSLCYPKDSQQSSPTPQFKNINSSAPSLLFGPTLTSIHDYWENHSFDYTDMVSLLFNTLSGFVIAFLPRSKFLLISWLQSLSTVILEPKKIKPASCQMEQRSEHCSTRK